MILSLAGRHCLQGYDIQHYTLITTFCTTTKNATLNIGLCLVSFMLAVAIMPIMPSAAIKPIMLSVVMLSVAAPHSYWQCHCWNVTDGRCTCDGFWTFLRPEPSPLISKFLKWGVPFFVSWKLIKLGIKTEARFDSFSLEGVLNNYCLTE